MIEESGSTFAMQVGAWIDKVGLKADLVFQDILIDVSSRTIQKTPVDTGMLRANWQVGSGAQPMDTVAEPDPVGMDTVARIANQVVSGEFKAGTVAFLANNLPYALPIEYGSGPNPYAPHPNWHGSMQAPEGMLRISVQEYEAEFGARVAKIAGEA
jgi:hypothetical protein